MRLVRWVIRKVVRTGFWILLLVVLPVATLVLTAPDPEQLDSEPSGLVVNDVTGMNPVVVRKVVAPTSVEQVQQLIRSEKVPVSIGGGHFSMGGQTASEDTLHLDMREMNRVLKVDKEHLQATVEAGITWHKLIEALDPEGLSVKIMQSYSNFTVGGSVSVNVHGRYIGFGPISSSVEALKVVLADGSIVEASRTKNAEIFSGCIGGYGGLGVIVEVTLNLAQNVPLKRELVSMPARDYPEYFKNSIRDNRDVVFQNADLIPNAYDTVYSIVWKKTDQELTEKRGVSSPRMPSPLDRLLAFTVLDIPHGVSLRRYLEPLRYRGGDPVVWRNFEASYDVADLAPLATPDWSFVLQEYFVPVARFKEFSEEMTGILNRHNVTVGNLSVRHALPDSDSTLAWAREEVFAFVLYYRQPTDAISRHATGVWTRELVEASLRHGGTYYLPYQPLASMNQFQRAYPQASAFFDLKKKLDPQYRFRNKLWDAYYQPDISRKIFESTVSIPAYYRPEDQSFLTVPEWQLVFASEDIAAATASNSPSDFPYFKSALEFWKTYTRVFKATFSLYPVNWGYHFMNCVIGLNTTVEYLVKGIYEATIGSITTHYAGGSAAAAQTSADAFINRIARDYAAFIHTEPWYRFPFARTFDELQALPQGAEDPSLRFFERKLMFSVELLAKAALSRLFTLGTEAIYGEEDLHIHAVVEGDENTVSEFIAPDLIQKRISDTVSLVKVPRYQAFTDLVRRIALDARKPSLRLEEIAGNQLIVFSVIAPKTWYPSTADAALIAELSLFSRPEVKRVVFSVRTRDLIAVVRKLQEKNISLDHVFDY